MIKMIEAIEENISGYGYKNEVGNTETVMPHEIYPDILKILVDGKETFVYISDVPKLIKALTLAAKL